MVFVKLVKGKPYFKRFQTQFRRRREGKTDYYARKRLILQDKDKYNSAKYRLVVRTTCSKVVCQVLYSTLKGDRVVTAAESSELKRFGLTSGLTNYAAHYATGLLLARRLLKQVGMDKLYPGNNTVDGEVYDVGENPNAERRPFLAVLDVGLVRTTIGNKVFGALKGAADGGLYVPHNNKRFPGFSVKDDKETYDAKAHRDRIFGVHIDKYMAKLKKNGEDALKRQFGNWLECLKKNGATKVEEIYKKIHAEIRKNSDRVKRGVKQNPKRDHTKFLKKKLSAKQRKQNALKRLDIAQKQAAKKGKK